MEDTNDTYIMELLGGLMTATNKVLATIFKVLTANI